MRKPWYFMILALLLTFPQLAHGTATVLPSLIGEWKGTTTAVGGTAKVTVTLTLTSVGSDAEIPNEYFLGSLTAGAVTINVVASHKLDLPFKVDIYRIDVPGYPLIGEAKLDWLPGPMLLVHSLAINDSPHRPFILKKTTR
ncbi:MAG: hypothetical protein FJ126_09690 [Deltaproteobacteria bacterium]|nr:hypothetical protein [Deltaproteobacteria bacterium]